MARAFPQDQLGDTTWGEIIERVEASVRKIYGERPRLNDYPAHAVVAVLDYEIDRVTLDHVSRFPHPAKVGE